MTTTKLVGGGSTQSRARRPLPHGYVEAFTERSSGVIELVSFRKDGSEMWHTRDLLTWVVGQAGLLWGSIDRNSVDRCPIDVDLVQAIETPGSYGHIAEHTLAQDLGAIYEPLFEADLGVRFWANGSDACSAAARIARAVTGRDPIASYGYHGSHSEFSHYPQYLGVPQTVVDLHKQFEWGDVAAVRVLATTCAAIVVEVPPTGDYDARTFLAACREACDAGGALLVIDDVVLGFRVALGGSLERYGVRPDLVVLGKAMCAVGGVSAVIGPERFVDRLAGDVFYSSTFGGHPFLMRLASDTIAHLRANAERIYGTGGHLQHIGGYLMHGLNEIFEEEGVAAYVCGQYERSTMVFPTEAMRRMFCGFMIQHGVIVDRPFFPTMAHTINDVDRTLGAARLACRDLLSALAEGEVL